MQITRRAYRAGESEFFINRQHVRLRDIIELLMGTGLGPGSYAIVSQGQIDAILSSKPTERRSLFEETAGIAKFLARKAESLRRLEQTEQNAIRVNDLFTEIGARIPELETQVRRARRFRRASARLRDLEILSYLRAGASRRSERERLQSELERLEVERAGAAARAATVEAELAALRTQLYQRERALETLRAETMQARSELAEREAQFAALGARREALEAQSSQITDDRERAEAERATLRSTVARLEAELAPRSDELEAERAREAQAQEAVAAARVGLESLYNALREVEAAAASAAASDAERRAQLQATQAEYERLERESFALREDAQAKSELVAAHVHAQDRARGERADLEGRFAAAQEATARADARVAAAAQTLADAQAFYRAATHELAGAEARLHTIEELEAALEGHIPGTRAILEANARGEFSGIHGVISNLIRVEEKFARALDVAFGAALSNIVTQTAEDAERAIRYLSEGRLGRATFLPLDTLGSRAGRERSAAPSGSGIFGWAYTLVETQPQYAGIVAFLVGRMLVVDTLDTGIELVRGRGFRDTIVTLDGEEIRGGGALTGGRYQRERSILSRRAQARALSEAIPQLREMLAQTQAAAESAAAESAEATRERDEAHRIEAELGLARRDAVSRFDVAAAERTRLDAEIASLLARSQERAVETAEARRKLDLLERPAVDPSATLAERERLETDLAGAREHIAGAQSAERAVASEIAAMREAVAALTAQRDGALARLGLLDADGERAAAARTAMTAELASLAERLASLEEQLRTSRARIAELDARQEAARREREALEARANGLDSDLRLAQNAEREAAQNSEGGRLRLAEIDAELGMLAAQFAQNPATDEECADVETRYANERDDPAAEMHTLARGAGALAQRQPQRRGGDRTS